LAARWLIFIKKGIDELAQSDGKRECR
jgi:hypothetical protein